MRTRLLYRALNPVHARPPLFGMGQRGSGEGSTGSGARGALHLARPDTALREANQVGTLQPTTLVAYTADIEPLLDSRDPAALVPFGLDAATLSDPAWRDRMLARATVPTHDLAVAAIAKAYAGILVRSFARGAGGDALNLVLWAWGG